MQLTNLEIFGFKSFADRTKFVFDQGITGIVGPNGCGKSNVVDSIRWVLGEQRSKNLRSDKMENIIFNGTQKRRKANFAEVSLTFQNTKNLLPTEYTTITITRKLYRDGNSEYQLNGITCRLKDIQNLFMDTGISYDSYAIIELKMVDEILTNKDNERRKFLEEAAGIAKYKIRKKQTLKKLQDTDADLERVEDLLFEINKNLKTLEKQARRTQKYFEIKEQYKVVSAQFALLTLQNIREKQKQIEILGKTLNDAITQVQSQYALKEARIQELKKELLDHERLLSDAQRDLNQFVRRIQSVETEKSIKNERLKYLQQREVAQKNQLESTHQRHQRNMTEVAQLRTQSETLHIELSSQQALESELSDRKEHLQGEFAELQDKMTTLNRQQKTWDQQLQNLIREKEIKHIQSKSLESELLRAEEDKSSRSDDLDSFAVKTEQLTQETQALQTQLDELTLKNQQHETQLLATETSINELKDKVYKTNRLLDAKQNEFNLTKSLVDNLEGFPESVKFLKKNAKWIQNAPLVSDIITSPDEYRIALENYLDNYLSYYVVKSRKDAILAIHMLSDASKGRANFFVLDELDQYKGSTPILFTQASPALEVVEFASEYKKLAAFLLANVYLVPNESDIPADIPEGVTFLIKAGNISSRRFSMSGGSLGLFEGKRLGRAKNLDKLQQKITELQEKLSTEKAELDQKQATLSQLKSVSYKKELERVNRSLLEREKDLSVLKSREKEHREFLLKVGRRADQLSMERDSLLVQIQEIEPQLTQKETQLSDIQREIQMQDKINRETELQLQSVSQSYNQEHIRMIHLRNQSENLLREIKQKEAQIQQFESSSAEIQEDLVHIQEDIEKLINSNQNDDEAIVRMYQQKKEKETRTDLLEQQVAQTKNQISQVEDKLSEDRKQREEILERQSQLKENSTEVRIELNSLRERMEVEFQLDIYQLQAEAEHDPAPEDSPLEQIEERLVKLRQRIQNFGEINPMAVEAYNEMKERFDFITEQKQDLLDAKQSLEQTIAEIDETAREKFLATFKTVRENFINVFRSLFSEEDKCDLILVDAENPLESELSIIARPKGKRPLTIKQLSGGEKTLTAIALLFAIYLIKPAPFCIFDEVDAPLDDANIDKFNNIIRDFSKESQFIIVTHNKRTMAATNVIYGVTMENQGVSRALPVNFGTLELG